MRTYLIFSVCLCVTITSLVKGQQPNDLPNTQPPATSGSNSEIPPATLPTEFPTLPDAKVNSQTQPLVPSELSQNGGPPEDNKSLAPNDLRFPSNQLPQNNRPSQQQVQPQNPLQGQVQRGVLSSVPPQNRGGVRNDSSLNQSPPSRPQEKSRPGNLSSQNVLQPNSDTSPQFQNLPPAKFSQSQPSSVLVNEPRQVAPIAATLPNTSSMVQPTGFTEPIPPNNQTQPSTSKPPTNTAEKIVNANNPASFEGSLPGEPVGLVNVLQNAAPQTRREAVRRYWNCYGAWLKLRFAEQEATILKKLRMPQSAHEQTMIKTAIALGESRLKQAKLELQKTQRALVPFARTQHPQILPLAKDLPLVKSYQTRYELYARQRIMPQRARQIHLALPKQKELLESNAKLFQQGLQSIQQAHQAYDQNRATVSSLLEAIRLFESSQTQFVQSLMQYNLSTAEYAFMVTSPYLSPQRTAAMLIPMATFTPQMSSIANQNVVNGSMPTAQFGRPTQFASSSVLNSSRLLDNQQIVGRSNVSTVAPKVASLPNHLRVNQQAAQPPTQTGPSRLPQNNSNQWANPPGQNPNRQLPGRQPTGNPNTAPPTVQPGQFGGQFGG